MYAICDMDGEVLERWPGKSDDALALAIIGARTMLEDDPELRELTVWQIDPSGNLLTHHRTITHGPDANWDSIVVVLKPGEHVRAPGPIPRQITEEDLDGYDLDDPKRAALESRIGEWY